MKDRHICNILMILGIVTNTVPRYSVDWTFGERKSYYVLQAASFLFILVGRKYYESSRATDCIYEIAVWLAVSNFMDELFFDPLTPGINEIFFAIFIIIWTIVRSRKWSQKTLT